MLSFLSPFRALFGLEYPPGAIIAVAVISLLLLGPVARDALSRRLGGGATER